jgi:predicted amidophosphoribosyltransferase
MAGICGDCAAVLSRLVPYETVPTPAPYGLPICVTLGAYEGVLRELVLAYKDRGRHRLARPLAGQLARGVAACVVRLGCPPGSPVAIVPVPSTAAATRERHGDHMRRLARHAVRTLQGAGWPAALAGPATARPRPDSAHLTAVDRAASARDAFRVRSTAARRVAVAAAAGACVIAVDDVLTTGATLASLTTHLAANGVAVRGAVTLAATRRRLDADRP